MSDPAMIRLIPIWDVKVCPYHLLRLIPHSQIQLCRYYPHYLVVNSKRDQNNPHFFDAAIIRIGTRLRIYERNSKIMRIISKARSKVTPSPHAHPSFPGFFFNGPLVNKVRIIFGSSEFVNAIFIELSALFLCG